MDNSQAPSSILDTLRTVEFRLGLKGYNVDEVDEYLDKAAQEAEALQEHVRQLNERLRQASERIAQLERDKRAAPVAAAESEESVAAAAGAAAAAAEASAAQLQAETHQKLRDEVSRLEATRTELATDVESMARHLESERNRLRGALSEILKWVDENVQPANSLMGVKPKAGPAPQPEEAQGRQPEPDDGAPTLNLESASISGAPGSL